MSRLFRHIFWAWLCAAMVCPLLAGDERTLAPQDGLLLLRTGGVLSGRITRAGDRYLVAVPDGEVRLKVSEVELVCRDLEDGYQQKRTAIASSGADGHVDLGDWCLRQGLLDHAQQELNDATRLDPHSPRALMLRQRVDQALKQKTPAPAPPVENQEAVSNDDLDRLVRGMPPRTVEVFTQAIQPLLLNSCAAAGCHGPRAENHFQLIRNIPGRAATRRLTQRNLQATLQFVDTKNPADSLLLTIPTQPHGTAGAPIFTNLQNAQYAQLAEWVASIANAEIGVAPVSIEEATPSMLQNLPSVGGLSADGSSVHNATGAAFVAPRAAPEKPLVAKFPHAVPKATTGQTADKTAKPAPDPFDPEAFNRRFHPPASTAEAPPAADAK